YYRFELNISNPNITKEVIINGLNDIAKENNGVLVKVVTNAKNYEKEKDIIWFGDKPPIPDNIVIENGKIQWLDMELFGDLISSKDMGNRAIYGTYAVKGTDNIKDKISEWANRNDIAILWNAQNNFVRIVYGYLVRSGIGNAIVTAFLLYIATLIAWFVVHARARSIRLLGGLSERRIHIEDTFSVMLNATIGFLIALITVVGYIGIFNGFNQIPLLLSRFCIIFIFLFLLSGLLIYLISRIVRPKTKYLATRQIPLKRFSLLGTGTRALSIVFALLIIPSTLTSAYIVQQLSKEYSLWETMQNSVRIGFNNIDLLLTENMLPNVEKFCYDMAQNDNMRLSYAVDSAILLSPKHYGGYDHIIVTDKAWIDSFDIGVGSESNGGELMEVSFDSLAEPLRYFLNAHMPLWTKEKTVQPEGIGYYEFWVEHSLHCHVVECMAAAPFKQKIH
ncbi:MAG: hypothetical protein K2N44_09290, partial [Lachnospiraceae bacterium]|nr:hypothetical protein [Lachnospiraceae bacterium]